MSHSFETRTITVSPQELSSSFSSLEEFEEFRRNASGIAHGRSDGLHHLAGSTRSGWAIYLIKNLLEACPDTSSLQFLADKGQTFNFETEYGQTAVSVIASDAVDTAVKQLDGLLSSLRADPTPIWNADDEGMFSDGEAETAVARDYVSAKPAYDRQVRGDEGQGADYLLTYLRSMLALLRTAQGQGLSVVHTLVV